MTDANTIVLALFLLAQLADVVTTLRVLAAGGVEMNPVVKWIMDRFGKGWVVIKLASMGALGWWAYLTDNILVLGFGAVVVWLVALNNLRVLRKYR